MQQLNIHIIQNTPISIIIFNHKLLLQFPWKKKQDISFHNQFVNVTFGLL